MPDEAEGSESKKIPNGTGRVCYYTRVSATPGSKSRQGVQEFHARLFARLGRKRVAAAKISESWYWRVTVMAFVATRRL